MNVTITDLSEAEVLRLSKWMRKHTSSPNTSLVVTKDES